MSSGPNPTVSPHDATTPAEPGVATRGELPRGTKVGRYELLRVVGRGGMGTVYAAHDPQLDRQVALKLLHPGRRTSSATLISEAKALARLDDPHVVQVFDAGDHEGEVFIAMQLVEGDDLAVALVKRHPRPPQIISWFVDAGRGLAAAHAAGLVHRDFKASNVLLDRRGRVAVTDFGLAVSVHEEEGLPKGLAGTPLYMSPEQHSLAPATALSDQFAFCVSMWEALFGKHPYVERDPSASTAVVGHQILEAPLATPPRGVGVSRRVIDALTRGLARDPAERWPTMNALLAELRPNATRRRWPGLVLGGAAVVGIGAAGWLYAERERGPTCETRARQRLEDAWSPPRAEQQRLRFVASQRSYAATTANQVATSLTRYAVRWNELADDVCAGEHAASGAIPDVVIRRRACLDGDLDRMRAIGEVFDAATAETVDRATDIVATLPELGDCADPKVLLAGPSTPPPALVSVLDALDRELAVVSAQQAAGSTHTLDAARSIVAREDALNWGPSVARAHIALGRALAAVYLPALDELVRGAELAIANHLDREAIRAWAIAFGEAAYETKPDVISMLVTVARSTAARVGDPALALEVEIAYGRSLIQSQRWDEGMSICRPAIATASKLGNDNLGNLARDCMFEGLLPAGKLDELRAVTVERIASISKRLGPDAPPLATYESVLADADASHGNLVPARREIDDAVSIITKAFPDRRNLRVAEILRVRAGVELAEGKPALALQTLREARSIALAISPKPIVIIADIQTAIAVALAQGDDPTAALHAFEEAIAAARVQSNESVPLAILLLNYGQIVGTGDFEAGLRAFAEARQILDRRHDPRASYASAAMAVIEAQHHRWPDARTHAEEAIAFSATDPDAIPANTAELQFVLAQAIVETRGDRHRANVLARAARVTFATLGPGSAKSVTTIDRWLAKHR